MVLLKSITDARNELADETKLGQLMAMITQYNDEFFYNKITLDETQERHFQIMKNKIDKVKLYQKTYHDKRKAKKS